MKKLLIGTTNPGKFNEYKELLKEFGFEFVSPKDLDIQEPEETGKTYEENALLKAKYYFEKSGIPTLVDDGGFEIEALEGEPGVKSHRWLGERTNDENVIKEIIRVMEKFPDERQRQCKLVLSLAVATPFGIATSLGEIKGMIAKKASSKRISGMPYRSVMYFPNYDKYYCDLTEEEHEMLNHRRQAVEKIKDIFREISNY